MVMLLNLDVRMYTRSLRKSSAGKKARNNSLPLHCRISLIVDFGLLGNLKTHAMKIKMNRENKVATTAMFAFKLTNWQREAEADSEAGL